MAGLAFILALAYSQSISDRIDFAQYEVDSPIKQVFFCGQNQNVFLLLTINLSVYRSENKGFSWKSLNSILKREGSKGTKQDIGKVSKVIISKADPNLVAFIGTAGINWYSQDCGKTISALNNGRPMQQFHFHPTEPDWCLAASWNKCSDLGTENCQKSRSLFVTKDLGRTWTIVTDFVVQFAWGYDGLKPDIRKQFPKERIYLTQMRDQSTDQVVSGWSSQIDLLKSDDFFSTFSVVVQHGNKFLLEDQYILVAQAVENSREVQLMVASGYDLQNFYRAELPVKRIAEHSYTLLDTSQSTIFINVNHKGPQSSYGNLYISDFSGRRYSLSLMRNARNSKGLCDFNSISGLEGIYIANIYDQNFINQDQQMSQNRKKNRKQPPENAYKKTVITFDKGAEWNPLTAPEKDCLNKRILCPDDDCSLHLHGISTKEFPPYYSNQNAIGIIMATGNVGYHLSYQPDEVNTFMSRDGGLTWFQVKKGSHIYEIGDHGALLVMADDTQLTAKIYYSWNQGLTWESFIYTSEPLVAQNIIIEPGSTSQVFLLYGQRDGKGVTVSFDFSSLHEPQCRYPQQAGSARSDFQVWSPQESRNSDSCLMGRKVQYIRRKREAECFNGQDLERQHFIKNCECTRADFECDLGYYREGKKCKVLEGQTQRPDQCLEGFSYYEVPTGYRRVPGNSCIGGVSSELQPLKVQCQTGSMGKTGYMILTVLLVAGILIILSKYSDVIQKKLAEFRGLEIFDRTGYSSDLTRAPEGMVEENPEDFSNELKSVPKESEEFDPRSQLKLVRCQMEEEIIEKWMHSDEIQLFYNRSARALTLKKGNFMCSKIVDDLLSYPIFNLQGYQKKLISAMLSPDRQIIAFQWQDHKLVIIIQEIVDLETKRSVSLVMGVRRKILGYHWVNFYSPNCNFVMITSSGIEFYKFQEEDFKFVNVKGYQHKIGHYWHQPKQNLILLALSPPELGQILTFFPEQEKGPKLFNGPRFSIDISPCVTDKWTISPANCQNLTLFGEQFEDPHKCILKKIYNHTYFLHLSTLKGILSLYTLQYNKVTQLNYKIEVPSGFSDIRVSDNLIIIQNYQQNQSWIFDISSKKYNQNPFVVLWHGFSHKSPKMTTRIKVYIDKMRLKTKTLFLYDGQPIREHRPSSNYTGIGPYRILDCQLPLRPDSIKTDSDIQIDLQQGRCYRLDLQPQDLIDGHSDSVQSIFLLLRRSGYKRSALQLIKKTIQEQISLIQIAHMFSQINLAYKKAALQRKSTQTDLPNQNTQTDMSSIKSVLSPNRNSLTGFDFDNELKVQSGMTVLLQSDMNSQVFQPLYQQAQIDFQYLAKVLLEYFHSLIQKDIHLHINLQILLMKLLIRNTDFSQLLQLLQCSVFADSQQLAVILLSHSFSKDFRPLLQQGVDMLYRLKDYRKLIDILVQNGYLEQTAHLIVHKSLDVSNTLSNTDATDLWNYVNGLIKQQNNYKLKNSVLFYVLKQTQQFFLKIIYFLQIQDQEIKNIVMGNIIFQARKINYNNRK